MHILELYFFEDQLAGQRVSEVLVRLPASPASEPLEYGQDPTQGEPAHRPRGPCTDRIARGTRDESDLTKQPAGLVRGIFNTRASILSGPAQY